jgi:hypothetical protein
MSEDLYRIESNIVKKDGNYVFQIQEFEKEISFLHGFELIKVIHPSSTGVGIYNGSIICIGNNHILPSRIYDKRGNDYTEALCDPKDTTYFEALPGDTLHIDFENIKNMNSYRIIMHSAIRGAIFPNYRKQEIKQGNMIEKVRKMSTATALALIAHNQFAEAAKLGSIVVSAADGNNMRELVHIHPREEFSQNELIQIQDTASGSLHMKLKWTDTHKISYLALGTSNSDDTDNVRASTLTLAQATDSAANPVSSSQFKEGVVLPPGNFIELHFRDNDEKILDSEIVTLFLKSKGYCYTITQN